MQLRRILPPVVFVTGLLFSADATSMGERIKIDSIDRALAAPVLMVCFTHQRMASLRDKMWVNFDILDARGEKVANDVLEYGRCQTYDAPSGRYSVRFNAVLNTSMTPLETKEFMGQPGVVNAAVVNVNLKPGEGFLGALETHVAYPATTTGDAVGENARRLLADFKGPGPGVKIFELIAKYASGQANVQVGCTTDIQCKGARICRSGACVDP